MSSDSNESTKVARELQVENLVDDVCDSFELKLRSGDQPDLRHYLERIPSDHRSILFSELLLLDWDYRQQKGESVTLDAYVATFPEFRSIIEELELDGRFRETLALPHHSTLGEALQQGTRIAHFQLERRVGAGAAGEVWKAWDLLLQRVVALKIPRKRLLSENELIRFQREGKAAAQLQHSGIVAVHEVGQHEQQFFIISDFIEGQDLRRWLAKSKPTSRQTAEICVQLAESLAHAHQRGVIHRDLKPANVILDRLGNPHITDFGLAKWAADESDMTVEGDVLGTPAYMSPEQARGDAVNSDDRSDIYSLGILLYEMLTGNCPFVGDHNYVLSCVIAEMPKEPRAICKDIPRDLETICLKAIEKNPSKRYPSAQEMAVDLRRYLRGDAIFARRISLVERVARWIRRRPAVVVAGTMGICAIAAIVGMLIYAQRNYELLGVRTVMLQTEPLGAEITFVPINERNGKPVLDQIVHAPKRTPLKMDLKPGLYLTVVVLDDGRFNEVFRRIPEKEQNFSGAFDHNRWEIDSQGVVIIPRIKIPPANVKRGMALIEAHAFNSGSTNDKVEAVGQVASFFLDTTEVSLKEFRQVNGGSDPQDQRWEPVGENMAVTVNYDEALNVAEKLGKRLPSEIEMAIAARSLHRHRSNSPPSSGNTLPESELGTVGTPASDRYEHSRPVFGLRSNVVEWTSSWPTVQVDAKSAGLAMPFLQDHRIVCCGSEAALRRKGLNVTATHPTLPCVPIGRVSSGLGFRCARSSRPRTSPADFGNADPQLDYGKAQSK